MPPPSPLPVSHSHQNGSEPSGMLVAEPKVTVIDVALAGICDDAIFGAIGCITLIKHGLADDRGLFGAENLAAIGRGVGLYKP